MPLDVDAIMATAQQLLPDELLLARAWLTKHRGDYSSALINVLVGAGFDPGPSYPDNIRAMSLRVTKRRIDIVAFTGLQPTLIELKDRIGLSAIGQLLTYKTLYLALNPLSPVPLLMAVGHDLGPDVTTGLSEYGIRWELI